MTDVTRQSSCCIRCKDTPADSLCCSAHKALLCHACYRRTHFVEVCIEGCRDCAREGLSKTLSAVGGVS